MLWILKKMNNEIKIVNAKENNLKSISLNIPKDKLIVFTGVSGSGKSSLMSNQSMVFHLPYLSTRNPQVTTREVQLAQLLKFMIIYDFCMLVSDTRFVQNVVTLFVRKQLMKLSIKLWICHKILNYKLYRQ